MGNVKGDDQFFENLERWTAAIGFISHFTLLGGQHSASFKPRKWELRLNSTRKIYKSTESF